MKYPVGTRVLVTVPRREKAGDGKLTIADGFYYRPGTVVEGETLFGTPEGMIDVRVSENEIITVPEDTVNEVGKDERPNV